MAIIALVGVVGLVLIVTTVIQARRTSALTRRLMAITQGSDERSLEAILEAHLVRVHQLAREVGDMDARTTVLERDLKRAFSRVGLVRYNPFEDTGGNQSFALVSTDQAAVGPRT